jgi:CRP-like cAMP-binding protein
VLQHVPAGERVYRIGEAGDALYLIESGEIELTAENAVGVVEEIGRIGAGSHFGEHSLLTGQIRTEDATATRNSNLWVLYKSDLDALSTQYPAIGKALSQGVALGLASGAGADDAKLQQFVLFVGMNPSDLRQIAGCLHPMRYRGGEQIFRAGSPAEGLYLIEKGTVGVQALGGAAWQAGPGESFGERALLTNQPHNTSAVAESDVDVWTMTKADFDMLMNRYPALAISMSRILSQRLSHVATSPNAPAGAAPVNMPPGQAAGVAAQSARRRQQAAAAGEVEGPGRRQGFGGWYSNLSGFGKLTFALLILVLILFLCVTIPFTVYTLLNGPAAALRAATTTLNRAVSVVTLSGSFEVAAADRSIAARLRQLDSQVPPTPTYTPFPTATPLPTNTPLPTATPTPVPPTEVPVQQFADEFAGVAAAAETPTPEAQPTPAPLRNIDPRIPQLGLTIEDAQAGPGQQYWRLIEARWEDEVQAGGKHHIYVEALDESGRRVVGQPITVWWGDGNYTAPIEDKPAPDLGYNYQMYASGYAYNVKVEGLPSDIVRGAGMGDLRDRFKGIHVAYYFVYQRATK